MTPTDAAPDAAAARSPRYSPFGLVRNLQFWQIFLFVGLILLWHYAVAWNVLPKFFFGEPIKIFWIIVDWFATGYIYEHLLVTLIETLLAYVIGTALGVVIGLWLGLSPQVARLLDPYLKALNAMPRVVMAPIFSVWFGLTIASKVALGVTLVFFLVFFNVVAGVRDANPTVLNSARMLGASRSQLVRYFYIPSAMTWVFSSLHASIGMAFVGAVIGEYLGSARGIGYVILLAESVFDINAVFAGLIVLTVVALALDAVVTVLENRVLAWRPAAS
jgi:sulfonate transport system permease protein